MSSNRQSQLVIFWRPQRAAGQTNGAQHKRGVRSERSIARNQSLRASCLKVLDEQRSSQLGRLDLRKVSDRRPVVQHIDAGGWGLRPNTRKHVGSTDWIGGAPDESLWTRIAFDSV
jgi:hypothetical protein